MKSKSSATNLSSLPIGIFDSGLGGLTVYKQIRKLLPREHIIYLGDTARVPYGSKSTATIENFAVQITRFLLDQPVKSIVIACNTASSLALDSVSSLTDLPVINVIEPGVEAALKATRNNRIAVIGTTATIESQSYPRAVEKIKSDIITHAAACPLFVPLVEEGWEEHPVTTQIAREYLLPLIKLDIDVLILGCTHYPILKPALKRILPDNVIITDASLAVAEAVKSTLEEKQLLNNHSVAGTDLFYVTDFPRKFTSISSRFLGYEPTDVRKVSIETLNTYSLKTT